MAKGFPYFKFTATEWLTGDIFFEDFELQGIFINVCAIYWHRDGSITIDEIQKRLKTDRLTELTDRFFSVSDGFISIKFLDEQLEAANHISKQNSENGKLGGRPKAAKTLEEKPTANRPLTDRKAKKSKEEEEQEQEVNKNKEQEEDTHFVFAKKLLTNQLELEAIESSTRKRVTEQILKEFNAHLITESKHHSHYSQYMSHLRNWLNKKPEKEKSSAKKESYGESLIRAQNEAKEYLKQMNDAEEN